MWQIANALQVEGRPTSRQSFCAVASLGEEGGRTTPGETVQGMTPKGETFLWANLQKIVDRRGRTGKKRCGWHTPGEGRVTPEWNQWKWLWWAKMVVSFSGDHPSDATGSVLFLHCAWTQTAVSEIMIKLLTSPLDSSTPISWKRAIICRSDSVSCDLDLWPTDLWPTDLWPLTLNGCSTVTSRVSCSNSVRKLSEIEQSIRRWSYWRISIFCPFSTERGAIL